MADAIDPKWNAYYDALLPFLKEFERESDRASVILGAARLDHALRELLRSALLPAAKKADTLLGTDRPLGTFSARIKASHRLGLIDQRFRDALDLVRRMRNDCAHEWTSCSLSDGPQADRVRHLMAMHKGSPHFHSFSEASTYRVPPGLPGEFRIAIAGMIMRLESQTTVQAPLAKEPIGLTP